MPANYDYEYAKAMQKYEDAKTLEEKIAALELMRSTAPSHKGAEKLRLDISKKLAKLKAKLESINKKKGAGKTMNIKKEGAAQVVLVGLPNSGKSTLLEAITNANPEIAPYEFTTTKPEIGIMQYKDANIQIVEVPAIIEGSAFGKAQGREKFSIIRNSDLVVFTFIGSFQEVKKQYDLLKKEFDLSNIKLNIEKPKIEIRKTGNKGIDFVNRQFLKADEEKVKEVLKGYGLYGATIVLNEEADLRKIEEAIDNSIAYKKAIGFWLWGEEDFNYKGTEIFVTDLEDKEKIKKIIYDKLDLIRVFTRKPSEKDSDNVAIVLKRNATVEELCQQLHKDFVEKFNFAKVWGSSKFPGQTVSKDFPLKENDVVEIYLKK